MRARLTVFLALSAVGGSLPAQAELDAGDYAVGGTTTSEERARLLEAIAAEREAEAARERARQAAEAEARRRAAEAEARRPREERLLEARCTSCHTLEQVLAARHTPIGWWLTVARMRWWNGAAMSGDEASILARHLARTQLARGWTAVLEHVFALLAVVLLPGGLLLRRWRQRRRWSGATRAGSVVGLLTVCGLIGMVVSMTPGVGAADAKPTADSRVERPSGERDPPPDGDAPRETTTSTAADSTSTEARSPAGGDEPGPVSMGLCSGQ